MARRRGQEASRRGPRWPFVVVLTAVLGLPATSLALSNEDLRRYGFGGSLTDAVQASREVQPPQKVFSEDSIPAPKLPSIREMKVPEAPMLRERVFRQSGPVPTPAREGPTADLRHPKAAEIEGSFKEVQNFFFRPGRQFKPILSVNEKGVTGLFQTATATIQRKGSTWFRTGASYNLYKYVYGDYTGAGRQVERVTAPFTYMTVPIDNLETSLQLNLTNEHGHRFPIPTETDWESTGVQDVQVMGKYRFLHNPSENLEAAFGLGLRVGVEENIVTPIGSNGVDYETFLSVTKGIKNFSLTLQGGMIFPNGENVTHSGVPDVAYANFGIGFRPNGKIEVGVEGNYLDWDHAGRVLGATVGAKYRVSREWTLDLAVPFEATHDLPVGLKYRAFASLQVML